MGLNKTEFAKIHVAAKSFATKNHQQYMAEAINCIRCTKDPFDAIELLLALYSSYVKRGQPKDALSDVGKWLDDQLIDNPYISEESVLLRLGWLRRLACFYQAESEDPANRADSKHKSAQSHSINASASQHKSPEPAEFGKYLDRRRKRRAEGIAPAPVPSLVRQPAPSPPERLPPVLSVRFDNFIQARDVSKTARDRAKKGKPPKDAFLNLVPTDEQFIPLAKKLYASTVNTVGFDTLFSEIEKCSGGSIPFYATEIESTEAGLFVRRFLLELPVASDTEEK